MECFGNSLNSQERISLEQKNLAAMENVIILGTGCAGFTAAIYAARANLEPLVLEGDMPGVNLPPLPKWKTFPVSRKALMATP